MMTTLRQLSAAASAAALAFTLPACAQAPELEASAAAAPAAQGPALWKVADEDTTIYLFGTVHALPQETVWFDGPIARAYDEADELVTEIEVGDQATMAQLVQSKAMLPAGTTLRSLMTEEDRAEFEAVLADLGLPAAALDQVEPWYAAMTLALLPLLQSGYSAESGVEMTLEGKAGEKERGALETVEQQLDLFDSLPMDAQLVFLDETVAQVPRAVDTLGKLVAEWLEGDADALAAILNDELDDPVLYERLLTARNANWAEWLDARMDEPGTVFVAVGAGHLAGKGSVQEQLESRGIEVERVHQ